MKKISLLKLILPLIFVFLAFSCTFNHLKHEVTIDDEITQLIRNVPSAESYPDAGIIYILDEDIVEVFEDGRCKETLHVVFQMLKDMGKDNGNIEIGYNSRTETASIIYARTITPDGKIIPLNENAVKVVTPYSSYPSYSDYKKLTFSMPGVTVGSIINYKVVIEKKPEIEGKFSSNFYFQTYDPTYVCRYKVITHRDTGVNIFIKRDVYTFPDEVNFGTIDLEKLNQNPQTINLLIQTVLVKRRERKGTDFQIKLEYNIPFISIKKEPESQSETYRLDVSLMPERMTRGKIDTLIRVLTNDKEVPEIRIPVVGEIW